MSYPKTLTPPANVEKQSQEASLPELRSRKNFWFKALAATCILLLVLVVVSIILGTTTVQLPVFTLQLLWNPPFPVKVLALLPGLLTPFLWIGPAIVGHVYTRCDDAYQAALGAGEQTEEDSL